MAALGASEEHAKPAVQRGEFSKSQVASAIPGVVEEQGWPANVNAPEDRPSAENKPPQGHVLWAARLQPGAGETEQRAFAHTALALTVHAVRNVLQKVHATHAVDAGAEAYEEPAVQEAQAALDTRPVSALNRPVVHAVQPVVPVVTSL